MENAIKADNIIKTEENVNTENLNDNAVLDALVLDKKQFSGDIIKAIFFTLIAAFVSSASVILTTYSLNNTGRTREWIFSFLWSCLLFCFLL